MEKEWWKSQIAVDIYETLRAREGDLPPFTASSPQLNQRRYLVDWLAVICEKRDTSYGVLHLAVYIMDHFMDKFDIPESHRHLVALTCLLLAAKYEEREDKIPSLSTLNKYIQGKTFTVSQYLAMELIILDFYSWNLNLTTPVHFFEYFLVDAVSESDFHGWKNPSSNILKMKDYIRKYTRYFLEVSLQHYRFTVYLPSLITASAVASSRKCLGLTPTWTAWLIKRTSYTWEQVNPLVDIMMAIREGDEKATQEAQEKVVIQQNLCQPLQSTPPCLVNGIQPRYS